MDRIEDRGTGRTTKQMQAAPVGSVFIWPVGNSIRYAKDLAHRCGRDDLHIFSMAALADDTLCGLRVTAVILDHETENRCSPLDFDAFRRVEAQIVRRP